MAASSTSIDLPPIERDDHGFELARDTDGNPLPRLGGTTPSSGQFIESVTGKRFIGKADLGVGMERTAPGNDYPYLLHQGRIEASAVREVIAAHFYSYFGAEIPRMSLSQQAMINCPAYSDLFAPEDRTCVHLMSAMIEDFRDYAAIEGFKAQQPLAQLGTQVELIRVDKTITPPTITRVGQLTLPAREQGLGAILAVASFINDVDVIGGTGGNIGFVLREDDAGQYVQTIKIDPGYGFEADPLFAADARYIRIKSQAGDGDHSIAFDDLPAHTRHEFLMTLHAILDTDEVTLLQFFVRPGTQIFLRHYEFDSDTLVAQLLGRRAALADMYADELADTREKYQENVAVQLQVQRREHVKQTLLSSHIPQNQLDYDPHTDVIGRGGNAIVYNALWQHTPVAIKVFQVADVDNDDRKRFEYEAFVLQQLVHPRIIRVFGVCVDEHFFAMVLERHQRSLYKALHVDSDVLTEHEKYQIGHDIYSGLAFLHDNRLLHRDIKSANVLLTNKRAVITDFGLAKLMENTLGTSNSVQQASYAWAAPELLLGESVSFAADVYSASVVLWEMASQQKPFAKKDFVYVLRFWMLEGDIANELSLPQTIHPLFAKLIRDCRLRIPDDRLSAADGVRAFEALLSASNDAESSTSTLPSTSAPSDLVVSEEAIHQLFHLLTTGQREEMRMMLNANPQLALATGQVCLPNGNVRFEAGTALTYALWSLDEESVRLLLDYLPQDTAIAALTEYAQSATVFDIEPLLTALSDYHEQASHWDREQRTVFWCETIGALQRDLPITFIQFYHHPNFADPSAELTLTWNKSLKSPNKWFTQNGKQLGAADGFAWSRGNGAHCLPCRWPSRVTQVGIAREALAAFYQQRIASIDQLLETFDIHRSSVSLV